MEFHWIDLADATTAAEYSAAWNRLWASSPGQLPNARWEHVQQWFQQFAPTAPRQALIVAEGGAWVAAIPGIARRLRGLLPVWDQLYSAWTPTPQWLLHPEAAVDSAVFPLLLQGVRRHGALWLRQTELNAGPQATKLLDALTATGCRVAMAPRYEIGQLNLRGPAAPANWAAYQKQLSGNFRRKIGKMLRRAESLGGIELVVVQPSSANDIGTWLQTGFEIEDRSWKGPAGCSVLRTPGMSEFYRHQAELLAARNELTLLFLKHRDQFIAFQYGWSVGQTYYSPKIGYDEAFAHLSPGHLLMHLWIERLFAGDQFDTFDFAGPVSESTSGWITSTYRVDRLLAGTGWLGNQLLAGGQRLRALKTWLQSRKAVSGATGESGRSGADEQPGVARPEQEKSASIDPAAVRPRSGHAPILPQLDQPAAAADAAPLVP